MVVRGDAGHQLRPPRGPPLGPVGTGRTGLAAPRRGLRHRREPPAPRPLRPTGRRRSLARRRCASAGSAASPPCARSVLALPFSDGGFDCVAVLRRDLPRLGPGRPRGGRRDGPSTQARRVAARPRARARSCCGERTTRPCTPATATRVASCRAPRGRGARGPALHLLQPFLFPLLLVRRTLDRLAGRHGSDVGFLPAPLEWAFRKAPGARGRPHARGRVLPAGGERRGPGPQARPWADGPGLQSAGGAPEDERRRERQVADELRRVREDVRERALLERDPSQAASRRAETDPGARHDRECPARGRAAPAATRRAGRERAVARGAPAPARASAGAPAPACGAACSAPVLEAQVAFNAQQVQLDNELLDYVDARLAATHRHYDAVLGRAAGTSARSTSAT